MTTQTNSQRHKKFIGIIGCIGAMFIHLVIGSLYQWGIINVYVTSYYHIRDESVTLEDSAVAFPVMMACVGITMKVGMSLSKRFHPLIVLVTGQILNSFIIYSASYMPNIYLFILFYGVLFGLSAGLNFTNPIYQCNKYLPGKRMYINGFILIGTGSGSLIFGLFSYNFLNPLELDPLNGYYDGTVELEAIANLTPALIRWLSIMYLCIGMFGVILITPVCIVNSKKQNQKRRRKQLLIEEYNSRVNQHKQKALSATSQITEQIDPLKFTIPPADEAHSITQAVKSKVFFITIIITLFGSCGCLLINGNYKTYVKNTINDDKFLTMIGVAGAIGNGFTRFFWNFFFSKTGFKTVALVIFTIQTIALATMRFTVHIGELYLFQVFLMNCCLGGIFVVTPTAALCIYGEQVGTNIYGIYWETFALSNFIGYLFVSQLQDHIGFEGVIYVCLGMVLVAILLVVSTKFQGPWGNPTFNLEYSVKKQKIKQFEEPNPQSEIH